MMYLIQERASLSYSSFPLYGCVLLFSPWYGSAAGFTDCYNLLNKYAHHTFDTIVAREAEKAKATK